MGGPKKTKPKGSSEPTLDFGDEVDSLSEETPPVPLASSQTSEPPRAVYHPSPFAVNLMALSLVDGLGFKAATALDKQIGLTAVFDAARISIFQCLHEARVPGADRITDELCGHRERLLEQGGEALHALWERRRVSVLSAEELPSLLTTVSGAPRWLFVEGNADALYQRPAIALVGTRTPSPDGLKATAIVSEVLSAYPVTVVSGLAEGIDERAHLATLRHNRVNVAFLGHGVNVEFPSKTVALRHRIIDQGGAVATEYLPDERYQKAYFVQRNRLQAALSETVIPIEATMTGGTSHTVRFARQYERQLLGIRWPEANGILGELENRGTPIFDVFTTGGRKALDSEVKRLVERFDGDSYPFRSLEEKVLSEFRLRNPRQADIARFIKAITESTAEITKDVHS